MNEKVANPPESVFGSLSTTQSKKCTFRFKWTINEFSFYKDAQDIKIVSSTFSDGTNHGLKWQLEVVAFSKSSSRLHDNMPLKLYLVSSNINHFDTVCKFGILNANLEEVNITVRSHYFNNNWRGNVLYVINFISENNLFKEDSDLLPNDGLTIFCEIDVKVCNENIPGAPPIPSRPNNLGLTLLENPEFSDITLCAGGKEIQAHKAILAARSNVFKAMFQNKMKESQTDLVNISDVDYEVLEKIVRFIYTDQFSDLHTVTDLIHLWDAANKYKLDRLKLRCEEKMGMNLSDQNAVECYIAAEKVNAENFKASVKSYITANITRVAKTSGFALLVHAHPDLVVEALSSIVIS